MSKRKSSTSKHARSPKVAAKAQLAAHAIIRSPKDSRLHSARAGMSESPETVLSTQNKRLSLLIIR